MTDFFVLTGLLCSIGFGACYWEFRWKLMNIYKRKIANLCRFCGKTTKLKSAKAKGNFKKEFATGYAIVIEEDNEFIHPARLFCG